MAPTKTSHHETRTAKTTPKSDAAAKHNIAATFTAREVANPLATSRTGPTRLLSVPRTPSL